VVPCRLGTYVDSAAICFVEQPCSRRRSGAAVRPVSTATTGGVGNPVLSLGEDAGSLLLVVTAFVLPLIALILVLVLLVGLLVAWRRFRREPARTD
jgi:hypothetical protein